MSQRRVSVICVTYNCADYVAGALASAITSSKSAGWKCEVIVVDNASADRTVAVVSAAVPDVTLIQNSQNVGFARANNQAFSVARGDVWLLLNPDTELGADTVAGLAAALECHPQAGAVAPSIHSTTGSAESAGMQPGLRSVVGHFLFVNRVLPGDRGGAWRGFQLHHRPELGDRMVEWASGAVLALRPEAARESGGFDPRFFLYGDDQDLGERLQNAGWEIWLTPQARARHEIAKTQGGVTTRWLDAIHDKYATNASRLRLAAFDSVIALGLSARLVIACVRSDAGHLHRRRLRAAAGRAVVLAANSLFGERFALAQSRRSSGR